MEQSRAMEYESRKASSDVLKPRNVYIYIYILLFSRLYDISTSSCAHWTLIVSSFSIHLCHSSLLPLVPFPPISPRIPSSQVSLGLPRFLLHSGFHFITCFGSLPSSILWTCPYHFSCLVYIYIYIYHFI
jgi:hypothetical protein